ncbi:MAG: hypothetical protein BWY85_01742 [Firmicutes bacterium ADurb.Bin506]|nr:MAG: hypothetical protein BWY85_01742 [Firmicutes bacterium ADurb.Bin506]
MTLSFDATIWSRHLRHACLRSAAASAESTTANCGSTPASIGFSLTSRAQNESIVLIRACELSLRESSRQRAASPGLPRAARSRAAISDHTLAFISVAAFSVKVMATISSRSAM